MRELGFAEKWGKLHLELPVNERPDFTTFRVPRKDAPKGRDWHKSEQVKIVYKPRSPQREFLGTAEFIFREVVQISGISNQEAIADGFPEGRVQMWRWLLNSHKGLRMEDYINKFTLHWLFPGQLR